ncbi:hypothetical protein [Pseudactinotalea terrae]|uniref:hypothetical protein n=1 Tax=Pseudactinotalea terrae TaxID=1743262 RepID=UPI0012E1619D|nr:hypothetical protein [Pseudactinotalea terrae]
MDPQALADPQRALAQARDAAEQATQVAAAAHDPGTALVPTGADAAVAVKAQMARTHTEISRARKQAMAKLSAAREAIKAQQAELDRAARALEAELAPLQEKLALMQEGIWTMNLYLGRDEEIVQLAAGEPAPAGTPIHVRQQVLAMDEESAINAEGGGIDFRNVEAFDQWITASVENLEQVLPETRGVVAIVPRRSDVDYQDTYLNAVWNEANKHAYWLIRNGENLYRMDMKFETGPRLVPARDEFTSMFIDRFTKSPLQPGTSAWMRAEKAASARERHFMRVALILQGLIDRTHVFHPLPREGVSLLSPRDYDDGHVVLIADDEHLLTTGRVGFYQWLAGLNAQLRTGMRVMVATSHHDWRKRSRDGHHERLNPPTAESPRSGQVYVLKRKGERAGEFVLTYPRTEKRWMRDQYGRDEFRVPSTPASCRIRVEDRFIIPIDLVDVETMRTYMTARTERHAYLDMFPTLRAAIAFKEAETELEAPFRHLLAAQVAQVEGVDLETAHTLVDPVITTWKVGARWFRPMTGDREAEARAARAILAERARFARANAGGGDDAAFVTRAVREHSEALLVARKKDGTYVVLTPTARAWAEPSVPTNVWVDRHEYTRTGKHRSSTEWSIAAPASTSRWVVLHEAQAWTSWNRSAIATEHLTDPEICEVLDRIRERTFDGLRLMTVGYDETGGWWSDNTRIEFTAWYHPGPVPVTDRPLTDGVGRLAARTVRVAARKDRNGDITLRWGRYGNDEPTTDNTTYWQPPFNQGLQPTRTAEPNVPWSDNRGKRLIWTDADVFAAAQQDARAWERQRHAAGVLGVEVEQLMAGVERDHLNGVLAAARARFLEDYPDEELWAEEEAKIRSEHVPPLRKSSHAHLNAWYAVRFLARRLTELGRAPWGLTVGEAAAALDEPLSPRAGSWRQDWFAPETLEEPLPQEIATLRFPASSESA